MSTAIFDFLPSSDGAPKLARMSDLEKFVSSVEAAEELNCTVQHIGYLCRNGLLEGEKFAGRWVVTRESLEAFKVKEAQTGRPRGSKGKRAESGS